ncbi:hypothetical protein X975_08572, partial [Stegodyphus mimosarum]
MADENSRSNPVSSLLGYKSLDDNQQNEIQEQHINPAFEDSEIPYIPSLNGNSFAYSLDIPNPRMNKCTENGAYIESYLSPPIPPYFDGHGKESNISIMSNQFTNDLGLKGIPKVPNGLHEDDSGSTKEKKEKDSDDDS